MMAIKDGISTTIRSGISLAVLIIVAAGCDESITDFGFTGGISGTITDQAGAIVSGDVATAHFRVFALGELDDEPMEIRVNGDGTYANEHLYPQRYQLWIDGPVLSSATQDTPETVDATGAAVTQDFSVTPFLTIPAPTADEPTSGQVSISYSIAETDGHVVAERSAFVSTASWPGLETGSVGNVTHTIIADLPATSGTVTVTGLEEGRDRYYVRIGARAEATDQWNMSEQVVVDMP